MFHILTGNTGSGKTTYANQLKKCTSGIIFSIDKWHNTIFLADKKPEDGLDWFLERMDRAEDLIMSLIEQLEDSKTDAILDLGFSKLEHLEKFRQFAQSKGYNYNIHFLDISRDTTLAGVMKRNHQKGDTYEFEVSQENFEFMETWFAASSPSEMKNGITILK